MMRGLKIWSACAVVGVVMATAAFGAGSASAATELCEVTTSPCPAISVYPASTTFTVNGEFGINPITGCEFTYKFVTGASSGSPLPAEINSWTFTRCGTGYTVSAVFMKWKYQITVSGTGPNGTGKMLPSKEILGFEVNGNGESGCQYTATSFPQSITGGNSTTATGVALANSAGSGCASGATVSMSGFSSPKFFVTN